MGTPAGSAPRVIGLAIDEGSPARALAAAEAFLLARRDGDPAVEAATRAALHEAAGPDATMTPEGRAALALASLVERHGASFPPGQEPAYHDRHHQAEAILAMGWLAGAARRLGLLDACGAARAVAAMAGHDLLHDGSAGGPRGELERRSAAAADEVAAICGVDAQGRAEIGRIILATTWPWEEAEAPDLACRLAREADLFASTLPTLGMPLARRLARELAAAGQADAASVASHAARIGLLRTLPQPTEAAQALGLDAARDAQIAAYAAVARQLGAGSAEAAAAALDAMDAADAAALLAQAGRGG
ncbi:hypothetical protein J5Y09_02835 [Roseomonas sp. PWR1]|uniref:Uncharacterized protein n=1 Tax=Roseomonas nitratireducens TaxID=2820810 RepID=A0ABS4APQ1_9PROT|nr:hypothetical protein [Neoroseomonas nitratireducens]MBP0462838.1 hypothetical protein [Neoroseomonas nitratireducens]